MGLRNLGLQPVIQILVALHVASTGLSISVLAGYLGKGTQCVEPGPPERALVIGSH